MRIAVERQRAPSRRTELVEIVTPRTNIATITPAENLLAAISLAEPFGLEIAATGTARWFLARAESGAMRCHLESQLAVAYPQAEIRRLDLERYPGLDPAGSVPDEQAAACALILRAPQYLPLRTFRDAEVEAVRSAQADPVLGILGAMDDLPEGWRALAQLVLRPAPDDWCRGYLRLAVEHPLASERASAQADTSLTSVFLMAGLLAAGTIMFQGYQWYAARDWLHFGLLLVGILTGTPVAIWVLKRLSDRPIYDMRLVQEKVSRIAYLSQVRLAVFAPASVPGVEVESRLQKLAAAYRQFSLAAATVSCHAVSISETATCEPWIRFRLRERVRYSTSGSWPASGTCPRPRPTCRSWSGLLPASGCLCRLQSLAAVGSASRPTRVGPFPWRFPTSCSAATCCWWRKPVGASPRSCLESPAI